MLKHGRAGVPLEVMGLMLGSFEDEFTVRVIGACLSARCELGERELTTRVRAFARRLCDAAERNGRVGRGGGPRLPDQDD